MLSDSSIQLFEYFQEHYSRPPTPNPHEYPVRVNSKISRSLNEDPRYTVLPDRFINNSSYPKEPKEPITQKNQLFFPSYNKITRIQIKKIMTKMTR